MRVEVQRFLREQQGRLWFGGVWRRCCDDRVRLLVVWGLGQPPAMRREVFCPIRVEGGFAWVCCEMFMVSWAGCVILGCK